MGTIKIAAFGSSYRRTVRSGLGFVIQRGVEVGALLQVFLGVALGVGFFVGDFDVGTGWQYHGGRNGGSGDDGEEIEVHGGNPRVRLLGLPGRAVKQTERSRVTRLKSFVALADISAINTTMQAP
jgi:hypothetical protein